MTRVLAVVVLRFVFISSRRQQRGKNDQGAASNLTWLERALMQQCHGKDG